MTKTLTIFFVLVGLLWLVSVANATKFFTIWDICDFVCEKNCLYLGGVVGGACTYGRCACRIPPTIKPRTSTAKPKRRKPKRPFFHFVLSLPAKWFGKKHKRYPPPGGYHPYPYHG